MDVRLAAELVVLACWAAVHAWAGKLRFLDRLPRSAYLSAAGGISVAYVFLHVLPELRASAHEHEWAHPLLIEGLALLGLSAFYGLERMACAWTRGASDGQSDESVGVFRIHVGAFALYGAMLGLFLGREPEADWVDVLVGGVALGLHLLVNDHGLAQHHGERYAHRARFVLAAAPPVGWTLGQLVAVPETVLAGFFAFLAGAVILNTLKEELPAERESRFWAFAAGAGGYAAITWSLAPG